MWVQISSGQGPAECELAVGLFHNSIIKECANLNYSIKTVDAVSGRHSGTFKSVLLSFEEAGTKIFLENLKGSVLWICPSPYRPHYLRKNWFIDVEVFDEAAAQAAKMSIKLKLLSGLSIYQRDFPFPLVRKGLRH